MIYFNHIFFKRINFYVIDNFVPNIDIVYCNLYLRTRHNTILIGSYLKQGQLKIVCSHRATGNSCYMKFTNGSHLTINVRYHSGLNQFYSTNLIYNAVEYIYTGFVHYILYNKFMCNEINTVIAQIIPYTLQKLGLCFNLEKNIC